MSATYDFRNVKVIAAGVELGDLNKDVFVSISYSNPAVSVVETTNGRSVFSVSRDRTATVTVSCHPSSNAHAILSGLYQVQDKTGGGQFPFQIVNANVPDAGDIFTSSATRVSQMPDDSFGAEQSVTEWVLVCSEITHVKSGILPTEILG